jgi:hypothetical protein
MFARLAEFGRAGELLEIAARDPERADAVAKLRQAIAARPGTRQRQLR